MTLQTIEPILYLPDDTPFFPEPGDDRQPLRLMWRALGLLIICAVAYIPVFVWGGSVWQDEARVTGNLFFWSLSGLGGIWSHAMPGPYHPLAQTILWTEHHESHLFGVQPLGYHLASVILHAVNAGFLWMVLRRLGVRGAWLAAALFAVHPVEVQNVAWMTQQPQLITAAFILAAVWSYLRLSRVMPPPPVSIEQPDAHMDLEEMFPYEPIRRLYALALVLAVAAALSGSFGLILPLVLLLLVWWKKGRVDRLEWLRLAPFFAIALIGTILAAVMAAQANFSDPAGAGPPISLLDRLLVDCRATWTYAASAVWPFPLLFVYARWTAVQTWGWIFAVALAAVIVAAWRARRWAGRMPLVAVLLFVTLLLPGLVTVLVSRTPPIYFADYWEYLALTVPLTVIAAAIVWVISWFSSAPLVRLFRVLAACAALGVLGFLTWQQGAIYDREDSVWQDALYYQPGSSVAVNQYSRLLLSRGQRERAWSLVESVAEKNPDDISLLLTRAEIYTSQNRYDLAIRSYRQVWELEPDDQQVASKLADLYVRNGEPDQAMRIYSEVLSRHPENAAMQDSMGLLLMAQGETDEAITHYLAALKSNPRFVAAKVNLSNAYLTKHDLVKAAEQLQQVIALDPRNYAAFFNAGSVLFDLRDFADAERMFHAAVKVQPNSAQAWDRLGLSQAAQGKAHFPEAIWNFDHAVRVDPDFQDAQKHLEDAQRQMAEPDTRPTAASDDGTVK